MVKLTKQQKSALINRLQALRGGSIRGKLKSAAKDVGVLAAIAASLYAGKKLGLHTKAANWVGNKITDAVKSRLPNIDPMQLAAKLEGVNLIDLKGNVDPSAGINPAHYNRFLDSIKSGGTHFTPSSTGDAIGVFGNMFGHGIKKRKSKSKRKPNKRRVLIRGRGFMDKFKKVAKVAVPTIGATVAAAVIANKLGSHVGSKVADIDTVTANTNVPAFRSFFPTGDINIARDAINSAPVSFPVGPDPQRLGLSNWTDLYTKSIFRQ